MKKSYKQPARFEDDLRWFAFQVYYHRSFSTELDLTVRFVKAIAASAQPIPPRGMKILALAYKLWEEGGRTLKALTAAAEKIFPVAEEETTGDLE